MKHLEAIRTVTDAMTGRLEKENERAQECVSYCDFAEVLISLTAACSQFLTLVSLSRTGSWRQKESSQHFY